jgi:cytochrome c biogenesis protein CcdA/thiol-disulfide isomerase/thioredoxin
VTLIFVALAAGLIAGISPCIVPVLPIIFVAGAANRDVAESGKGNWRRSVAIVLGLAVSFSIQILAGFEILSLLHLPQDFLLWFGAGILALVGLGFLIPQLENLIERPFARITGRQPSSSSGGLVIGLMLGLVFTPCAGPVLAAVIAIGARHTVNLMSVFVTLAFAIGAIIPLLFIALAGGRLVARVKAVREHAPLLRRIGGVVMILMAVGIGTSAFNFLTAVPGYTNALQNRFENTSSDRKALNDLPGGKAATGKLVNCPAASPGLVSCGQAPNFTDITSWLNTPHNEPLTMSSLRGKVVIVDFWTYSCINCQRTLPHVEAWYKRYAPYGLEIVGVHTPEFAFEHVVSNVKAQSKSLGVKYPIAIDDDYGTWTAYHNNYWPAEYLIDASGVVRHVDYGEGNYSLTEKLIRTLLLEANPGIKLPPPTSVPNLTPTEETNPESYVGYNYGLTYFDSTTAPPSNVATEYHFPKSLSFGTFAFSGVWDEHAEEATTGRDAKLELSYLAKNVYLVMGGTGRVTVSAGDGTPARTIHVRGVPTLYRLLHFDSSSSGTMVLTLSRGVQAYDFTFG